MMIYRHIEYNYVIGSYTNYGCFFIVVDINKHLKMTLYVYKPL